jgi:hypothetical protein
MPNLALQMLYEVNLSEHTVTFNDPDMTDLSFPPNDKSIILQEVPLTTNINTMVGELFAAYESIGNSAIEKAELRTKLDDGGWLKLLKDNGFNSEKYSIHHSSQLFLPETYTDGSISTEKGNLSFVYFSDVDGTLSHHDKWTPSSSIDLALAAINIAIKGGILVPITGSSFQSQTNTCISERINNGEIPPLSYFGTDGGSKLFVHARSESKKESDYLESINFKNVVDSIKEKMADSWKKVRETVFKVWEEILTENPTWKDAFDLIDNNQYAKDYLYKANKITDRNEAEIILGLSVQAKTANPESAGRINFWVVLPEIVKEEVSSVLANRVAEALRKTDSEGKSIIPNSDKLVSFVGLENNFNRYYNESLTRSNLDSNLRVSRSFLDVTSLPKAIVVETLTKQFCNKTGGSVRVFYAGDGENDVSMSLRYSVIDATIDTVFFVAQSGESDNVFRKASGETQRRIDSGTVSPKSSVVRIPSGNDSWARRLYQAFIEKVTV